MEIRGKIRPLHLDASEEHGLRRSHNLMNLRSKIRGAYFPEEKIETPDPPEIFSRKVKIKKFAFESINRNYSDYPSEVGEILNTFTNKTEYANNMNEWLEISRDFTERIEVDLRELYGDLLAFWHLLDDSINTGDLEIVIGMIQRIKFVEALIGDDQLNELTDQGLLQNRMTMIREIDAILTCYAISIPNLIYREEERELLHLSEKLSKLGRARTDIFIKDSVKF